MPLISNDWESIPCVLWEADKIMHLTLTCFQRYASSRRAQEEKQDRPGISLSKDEGLGCESTVATLTLLFQH